MIENHDDNGSDSHGHSYSGGVHVGDDGMMEILMIMVMIVVVVVMVTIMFIVIVVVVWRW